MDSRAFLASQSRPNDKIQTQLNILSQRNKGGQLVKEDTQGIIASMKTFWHPHVHAQVNALTPTHIFNTYAELVIHFSGDF